MEFLCPNGHKIHCPDEQAGRAAKCPRCGVKFRIPHPSEEDAPGTAADGPEVFRPQLSDSPTVETPPDAVDGAAGLEPQIEFLCPSGHRLHGPASLQGRPGEWGVR